MKTLRSQKPGISADRWIPTALWSEITEKMPIACVDIIFQKPDRSILYGHRLIPPYRNVWALLGGRILYGENLFQSARRIANEYGLEFERLYLNGVFPITFQHRSDMVISLAARRLSGSPCVDGFEFSKFIWSKTPPNGLGTNYLRMILNWRRAVKSYEFLRLNRLA